MERRSIQTGGAGPEGLGRFQDEVPGRLRVKSRIGQRLKGDPVQIGLPLPLEDEPALQLLSADDFLEHGLIVTLEAEYDERFAEDRVLRLRRRERVEVVLAEQQSGGCRCSPELGCVCGAIKRVKVMKSSAQLATPSEVAVNPRARAARLRAARKVAP